MPIRATLAAAGLLAAALTTTLAPPTAAAATECTATLWAAGTGGYASYRIPAIINVPSATGGSTLVAFAEARRTSALDNGDIDITERRSTDGGCTWTPPQTVATDGPNTVDNPVPMVDANGTIVLITNRMAGAVTQAQVEAGLVSAADGRRVFVQASADQGATWSARREITSMVKRPEWAWYATGPGHGVTIEQGIAKGRLVLAALHSEVGPLRGVNTLISDDRGATWRIGGSDDHTDGVVNPDETSIAELPNARLYLSARDQGGTSPEARADTYSNSSGSTLMGPFVPQPGIVTSEVEGSVLQDPGLPDGVSCHPLLYSGPEDTTVRQHLTIRRSDDDGATWRTVTTITGAAVPAGYSDITKTDRTHLGVLYETGTTGYAQRIDFQSVIVGCP